DDDNQPLPDDQKNRKPVDLAGEIATDDDNQPLPDDQKNRKPVDLAGEIATRITDEELKDALRAMVSDKRWSIPECHSFCQTREWDNAKIMTDLLAHKQNMVAEAFHGEVSHHG
ncbi:MAG TPA: hypothetical protein PLE60_15105, partial [Candidatus Latescibacteria bacterium]|nr:hypothetical protein [Candidatus Latescibacterota bacterium]